jgi:hypothetical protein
VEEIGRNSVRPSTMPRIITLIASSKSMDIRLFRRVEWDGFNNDLVVLY